MNESEVRASLYEDVSSLDNYQKKQFTDMSFLATNDVERKKGKFRKARIKMLSKDGIDLELVATNTTFKKNHYPKAEDKLKLLGFTKEVNDNLLNKIINGEINSNHINDLQKLILLERLKQLNPEDQNTIIKSIIDNRTNRNSINAEEISSYVIKNGDEDEFILDTWYRGMLRLIYKLSSHSNVGVDVFLRLSKDQQLNLKTKIDNLIYVLSRFD